jgi:A/G-specific adenine glycosylase
MEVSPTELSTELREAVRAWFRGVARDLPWRRERTAYRIWISEIMLQQTQVETVRPYFERFLASFPDPVALAAAPEDEVMAHWAGLGYYSRARNVIACARELTRNYGGQLPDDAVLLRRLPGFGPYTAAAVGSLAFGLPLAAMDGNVARVLSRLLELEEDPARPAVKARLQQTADLLLDRRAPGEWNEALMELGATLCLPRRPRCGQCPLALRCRSRAAGRQEELPRSRRRGPLAQRAVLVWAVRDEAGRWLARRRGDRGMLRGMWELPNEESPLSAQASDQEVTVAWGRLDASVESLLANGRGRPLPDGRELRFRHSYSHFQARVLARLMHMADEPGPAGCQAGAGDDLRWLKTEEAEALAFSARDRRILEELAR